MYIKGKHPLQSGCSYIRLNVLTDTASSVSQTGEALFFVLVSLIEKGKQRNNKATKSNQQSQYANENRNNFKSRHKRHLLPMYSGKPGIS